MMQAMKGATTALGSMNRSMNLPALQKIAMEFERENDVMEQRQEMMDDAIDDAMDVGAEEEGEEVVEQVLEEIGVDLNSAVRHFGFSRTLSWTHADYGRCAAGRHAPRRADERCGGEESRAGHRRRRGHGHGHRRWRRRRRRR